MLAISNQSYLTVNSCKIRWWTKCIYLRKEQKLKPTGLYEYKWIDSNNLQCGAAYEHRNSISPLECWLLIYYCCLYNWVRDVAQVVEHALVKVGIIWSSLHGGCICNSGCFPFQPVVHNWSIKDCGTCCPVCEKVHIKDSLLLIGKSSLCGDSGFHLKKYVTMTICLMSNSRWYENQCALEALLNKTNFLCCMRITSGFKKTKNHAIAPNSRDMLRLCNKMGNSTPIVVLEPHRSAILWWVS